MKAPLFLLSPPLQPQARRLPNNRISMSNDETLFERPIQVSFSSPCPGEPQAPHLRGERRREDEKGNQHMASFLNVERAMVVDLY